MPSVSSLDSNIPGLQLKSLHCDRALIIQWRMAISRKSMESDALEQYTTLASWHRHKIGVFGVGGEGKKKAQSFPNRSINEIRCLKDFKGVSRCCDP